jgi:hypothetical protein
LIPLREENRFRTFEKEYLGESGIKKRMEKRLKFRHLTKKLTIFLDSNHLKLAAEHVTLYS